MHESESEDVGDSTAEQVFPLQVAPLWRPSLSLLGVRRQDAYARLAGDEIEVRVGRYFHARIPVNGITLARAGTGNRVCHFGVCVRKAEGLALVASSQGAVEVTLAEPFTGRLLGRPVCFRTLAISLEQAEEFLTQIHSRLRQAQEARALD